MNLHGMDQFKSLQVIVWTFFKKSLNQSYDAFISIVIIIHAIHVHIMYFHVDGHGYCIIVTTKNYYLPYTLNTSNNNIIL